jgi:hypothetical protein
MWTERARGIFDVQANTMSRVMTLIAKEADAWAEQHATQTAGTGVIYSFFAVPSFFLLCSSLSLFGL